MDRRWLSLLIGLVIIFSTLCLSGYYTTQQYMKSTLTIDGEGIDFNLPKGGSLSYVAYKLGQQNILNYPRWLLAYSRLSGKGASVKAGDYFFSSGTTINQLLEKLEKGDVKYYQVTLVEGWTIKQVLQVLSDQENLQKTIISQSQEVLLQKIDPSLSGNTLLEGLLFPDTYRYHSALSDLDVLKQSYQRMQDVLSEEWQNREQGLPYATAYEALIMASLIEKETGAASERPEIAGVFVRRLQKGMRLQTDPTIIYGLGELFDGDLRSRHLKDATNPYNTYRHNGLPPTPIALAGREAIHAALHPAEGETLYFVAKGDGTHYFSRTLEEHQEAVRKYQIEHRRKDYSSSPQTTITKKKSG